MSLTLIVIADILSAFIPLSSRSLPSPVAPAVLLAIWRCVASSSKRARFCAAKSKFAKKTSRRSLLGRRFPRTPKKPLPRIRRRPNAPDLDALAGLESANHFAANDNFAGFDLCVDAGVGTDSETAIGNVNFSFERAVQEEIFPTRDFSFDLMPGVTQDGAFGETCGTAAAGRWGEGTVDGRASRADCGLFSSGLRHVTHLPRCELRSLRSWGTVGQAGGNAKIVQRTEGVKDKGQYQEWQFTESCRISSDGAEFRICRAGRFWRPG